jgi:hypothetical protein
MEQPGLLANLILLLLIIIILLIEISFAKRLDRKRNQISPQHLPYKWGFFFGINAIVWTMLTIIVAIFSPEISNWLALAIIAIWGIPGYFVVQRKKWAWIMLSIFSMNPFVWIANYFYGKNRWHEFN